MIALTNRADVASFQAWLTPYVVAVGSIGAPSGPIRRGEEAVTWHMCAREARPAAGVVGPFVHVVVGCVRRAFDAGRTVTMVRVVQTGATARYLTPAELTLYRAATPTGPPPPWPPLPPPLPRAPPRAPPRPPQPPSTPPPPPPPPPTSAERRVAALESQFWSGAPSDDLVRAGVLLRQFDKLSDIDANRPWIPCPFGTWCGRYHAQWPASVVNPSMRRLYYPAEGGMVLDGRLLSLFCAYNGDGNSMAHTCGGGYGDGASCIPGCYPPWGQCPAVGRDWDCSWPPSMLEAAMRAQLARGDPSGTHNELVIDTRSIEAHTPEAVLAFFYLDEPERADAARDAFLREYSLPNWVVPLVQVNLGAGGGGRDPVIRLARS